MLKPMEINDKEFGTSFRGYNREEVDEFLDQVITDYETLCRDNSQMQKELEIKDKQIEQYSQMRKTMEDTLLTAQKTSEEVVSTARARGEEIRQAAREAAENLKREAELYAERLKAETERECKRKIDEAAQQVRAAADEYERIVMDRRQVVAKMRNLMQTELTLLDDAYEIMTDKIKANSTVEDKFAKEAQSADSTEAPQTESASADDNKE